MCLWKPKSELVWSLQDVKIFNYYSLRMFSFLTSLISDQLDYQKDQNVLANTRNPVWCVFFFVYPAWSWSSGILVQELSLSRVLPPYSNDTRWLGSAFIAILIYYRINFWYINCTNNTINHFFNNHILKHTHLYSTCLKV